MTGNLWMDPNLHKGDLRAAKRRLWIVLACLTVTVSLPDLRLVGAAGTAALTWLLWQGVTLRAIMTRLLLILPFGTGALVFLPLTVGGETRFRILGLNVSGKGLEQAMLLLAKMIGANFLITGLLAFTPLFLLIKSLRSIGIPALLIDMISLMMRYFFLLAEEAGSMMKAQKARGFQSERWWWSRRTYRRFGELLGVLFVRATSRSTRIYLSMNARGGADLMNASKGTECGRIGAEQGGDGAAAVEVKSVSYRYGEIQALADISFRIERGRKIALMGPNGAGKSTLISLLNGLELAGGGEVRLFGETIGKQNRDAVRRRIGVVYQDPDDQIFSATVEEDVAFGPRNLGLPEDEVHDRVAVALGSVGMRDFARRSPFELSYGQKRRVAIAGVLAMRPDIIVMDEPMAFLDPKGRDELQSLLEGMHLMGLTLIVATHDVDFAAEWADEVLILKEGRLLLGGSTDLLFDEDLTRQAGLHLPRLARPFRLLEGTPDTFRPRNARQAAQMIWRLMLRQGGGKEAPTAAELRNNSSGA